jgi:hypothetical protein
VQRVLAQFDRRIMDVTLHFRNGFGFDIEYNEDICHVVGLNKEGEEEETNIVASFQGVIIKIPLVSLYIGDWEGLDLKVLET